MLMGFRLSQSLDIYGLIGGDYDVGLIDITNRALRLISLFLGEVIGLCLWFICESCDWCLVLCSWFYRCQHDKTMLIGADPSHVDDRKNCLVINLNFFSNLDLLPVLAQVIFVAFATK